jgi:hypothetical protein
MSQKLALPSKICPLMLKIAQDGLLKHGKLSITFLMRKLKCSDSTAKEIIDELAS